MPLTLRLHPEARVEIDPVLAERVDGVVEAAAGSVVVLGRPKNFGPRSRLVVSAADGAQVHMAPRCFFNGLTIRAAGGGCASPANAPSTASSSSPSTARPSMSVATACSAARSGS